MSSFFFQAEDGIRDYKVTGVQTCALPICDGSQAPTSNRRRMGASASHDDKPARRLRSDADNNLRLCVSVNASAPPQKIGWPRSEERRVGKERRARWDTGDEQTTHRSIQRR